jgi:hypothetical protein
MKKPKGCRHRKSWLIADASYEWCYECGAFRTMEPTGLATVSPNSPWACPNGGIGDNPWFKWKIKADAWRARRRMREVSR